MAKSKLEGLCRELQKHNQVIRVSSATINFSWRGLHLLILITKNNEKTQEELIKEYCSY